MLQNSVPYIRDWTLFGQKELKQILSLKVDRFTDSNTSLTHQHYDFEYNVKFTHEDNQSPQNRILQQSTTSDTFDPSLYQFIGLTIEYKSSSSTDSQHTESLNHQPTTLKFSPALSQWKVFALAQ